MNIVLQDEQIAELPSPATPAAIEKTSAESPDKNDTQLQFQKVRLSSVEYIGISNHLFVKIV